MRKKYKCMCCGYYTLDDGPGLHDICPVCYWEEDRIQDRDPFFEVGPNSECLYNARRNYRRIGACEKRFSHDVRKPTAKEKYAVMENSNLKHVWIKTEKDIIWGKILAFEDNECQETFLQLCDDNDYMRRVHESEIVDIQVISNKLDRNEYKLIIDCYDTVIQIDSDFQKEVFYKFLDANDLDIIYEDIMGMDSWYIDDEEIKFKILEIVKDLGYNLDVIEIEGEEYYVVM